MFSFAGSQALPASRNWSCPSEIVSLYRPSAALPEAPCFAGEVAPCRAGDNSSMHALNYDWRGRPRMLSSEFGMVAADCGTCSDMGESACTALSASAQLLLGVVFQDGINAHVGG